MSPNYMMKQFPSENFSLNEIELIILIVGLVEFFLLHLLTDTKKNSVLFFPGFKSSIKSSKHTSIKSSKDTSIKSSKHTSIKSSKDTSIQSSKHTSIKSSKDTKETVFESSIKQAKRVDQSVSVEDLALVMRSLGLSCNPDEDKLPESLDADDIFNLFEEQNPTLDELKEAFDVFDENRDGFIDAKELQKVLCALSFTEGSELENCTKMIGMFDENGDGKMDFDEFVKFME